MDRFQSAVEEQFGFSREESAKILASYLKAKAIKIDVIGGQFTLTNGAFWATAPMRRALGQ